MSQFKTFLLPMEPNADAEVEMNGFLKSHRVVDIQKAHDAAQAHWGGNWRMPTPQELSALNSNCDWTRTTRNGVKGYVVRGRGTYADASIFFPAAGFGEGTFLFGVGSAGLYWSSVPNSDSNYSWFLGFSSDDHGLISHYPGCGGWSVRPVQGFTE